jgi:tetratricopeptide (TPR) repeat protein
MECFYCRSVVPDDSRICPACGKELRTDEAVTRPEITSALAVSEAPSSNGISETEATLVEQSAVIPPARISEEATIVAQPVVAAEPTLVANVPASSEVEPTLRQTPVEDATLVQTPDIAAPVAEVVSAPEASDDEVTIRQAPTSEVFAFETPVVEQPTVRQAAEGEVMLVQSSVSDPAQIGTSIPETPYPVSDFASVPQTPIPGITDEQTAPPPYASVTGEQTAPPPYAGEYGTGEYAGYPDGYPVAPIQQPPQPREPHQFAKPLPTWAFAGGLVLLVAALASLFFLGKDWAQSATYIAYGALGAGILLLFVLIGRSVLGMAWKTNLTRTRQYVSNIIILVVLFASALTGLLPATQTQLHLAHGGYLRDHQQWELALNQYTLANETAPTSDEKALTYITWGEALSKKAQYEQGISKFDTALDTYTGSTTYRNRALKDRLNAYIDWGKLNLDQKKYSDAQAHFDKALDLINCEADCKKTISALDAKAYYGLGKEQLGSNSYDNAVTTFKALQSKFADSDEAKLLHGDLAKALLGKGAADKAKSCPSAVPTYKELASSFKDTPEGQQAEKDLAANQSVKGHFTKGTVTTKNLLMLTQGLHINPATKDFDNSDSDLRDRLQKAPQSEAKSDGTFVFEDIKQGTYQLIWFYDKNGSAEPIVLFNPTTGDLVYTITVGPLCPADFGDITYPFNG